MKGNCLSYVRHAVSEIQKAKCKHNDLYVGENLLHCETLDLTSTVKPIHAYYYSIVSK